MTPLIIILLISIVYALIRAKHDSFIAGGPWKTWAFIEGAMWAAYVVASVLIMFSMKWWMLFVMGPIFAFTFWLVFDCMVGYYFSGSILYIGSQGFDLLMRKTFKYNLPIFGWESGALILILVKLFWLVLLICIYFTLFNSYAP